MRTRRGTAGRLRGWGGTGAMGLACALTGTLLLVLPQWGEGGDDRADRGGPAASVAAPGRADADDCNDRSLSPSSDDGPTIDKIKNREVKKLVVGVDQNSYRWGYRDPNKPGGELEGFDIDLAHKIAEEIFGDRDAVVFRAIPTNQRIPAIQSGQVDMVVRTMTVNCKRLEDVDFSTGYFETGQQVLAPKKVKGITGYNPSLAGKKICSASGSIAEEELKKKNYGADISTTVPNQLDCLVRLQLGEVDAVVTDSALAAGQAAQDPTVELKGKEPFTTEHYAVAMKKGSDDLVRRVNKVLDDYRKDDGWQKSYDKWLKDGLKKKASPPDPEYRD
ncbi:glutamate ABC transporter substrate-binding protein [Streptomyces sp. NPDC046465]|uniref:glutamate ABC transporter substrate-binding protein n=1 Tax=Streptomyces sp. NPDC046465 TaxID=3155810 RepID=UPI0033EB23E2